MPAKGSHQFFSPKNFKMWGKETLYKQTIPGITSSAKHTDLTVYSKLCWLLIKPVQNKITVPQALTARLEDPGAARWQQRSPACAGLRSAGLTSESRGWMRVCLPHLLCVPRSQRQQPRDPPHAERSFAAANNLLLL